jgi:hypothetical protein
MITAQSLSALCCWFWCFFGATVATPLQEEPALVKASKAGDAERVARLLANGHDPTVRDAKGRSPYQLAANKEVRHATLTYSMHGMQHCHSTDGVQHRWHAAVSLHSWLQPGR